MSLLDLVAPVDAGNGTKIFKFDVPSGNFAVMRSRPFTTKLGTLDLVNTTSEVWSYFAWSPTIGVNVDVLNGDKYLKPPSVLMLAFNN